MIHHLINYVSKCHLQGDNINKKDESLLLFDLALRLEVELTLLSD